MARVMEALNQRFREQPNVTLFKNIKVENIIQEDGIPGGGWPMLQL
jgi:2-polyprenyl-6-methoxyphenol hydroxylase-like FAD-dependent oxidoreductase